MKKRALLVAAFMLLATFGVVGGSTGIVDTAEASGYGHKSSLSLEGRSFQIHGTYVSWDENFGPTPPDFENCYTFRPENVFWDPKFPDPANPSNATDGFIEGTWVQHTGGFITRYTAFATGTDLFGPGVDLQLIQNGIVTPTWRRGQLRIRAYSTVTVFGSVLGVVLSTGRSVDECPAPPE